MGSGKDADAGAKPAERLPATPYQREVVLHLEDEVRGPRGSEACRSRQLEDENSRLKRVTADLTLDN